MAKAIEWMFFHLFFIFVYENGNQKDDRQEI